MNQKDFLFYPGLQKGVPQRESMVPLKNEKGFLTLDFIFAFIIIFGFVGVLFSFAMTFLVVETIQYVSFASARNYSLAHLNEDKQKERAIEKYKELTTSQALSALLSNGWFEVREPANYQFNDIYQPEPSSEIFLGVRILFKAPILFKRVPFMGKTGSDPEGFTAHIQSFLSREPNFSECRDNFMSQRAMALKNLGGYNFNPNQAHHYMMDNGC